MAQPQMARITCYQCNAFYNSERELRDHMQVAHRQIVAEQSILSSSARADSTNQRTASSTADSEAAMDKLLG